MAANPYPNPPASAPAAVPVMDLSKLAEPVTVPVQWGDQPWQTLDPDRAGALLRLLRSKLGGQTFGNALRDVLLSDRADA